MRKTRVYISGPITKGDQAANVRQAIDAAHELMEAGYAPYCPHLTWFWGLVHPQTWDQWLELDKEFLPLCDVLLRLPGESKGADIETGWALGLGITIYLGVDLILEHCPATREEVAVV